MTPPLQLDLPGFLRTLATITSADATLEVIMDGPLRRFGAASIALWLERDDALALASACDVPPDFMERCSLIPIAHGPVSTTYMLSEVVIASTPAFVDLCREPTADTGTDDVAPSLAIGSMVFIPIVSRGVSIGVLGFRSPATLQLNTLDIAYLDGLSALLGLWITHPASPITGPLDPPMSAAAPTLISDRQRTVLQLVLDGHSSAAIAARLGCSISTVKQDIQRAQRQLHSVDRFGAAERAWELGLLADTP